MTNKKNGTLYVEFTDDIHRRLYEHKNKIFKGFSNKYNLDKLVYYETSITAEDAKLRESRIKKWKRQWKDDLIERSNPNWIDLSRDFKTPLTNNEKLEMLFHTYENDKL